MKMSLEHWWNGTDRGEPKYWETKLLVPVQTYSSTLSLPQHCMELRDKLQATAALSPEKELQLATAQEAGWARQPVGIERKIVCCCWRETSWIVTVLTLLPRLL